MDAQKRIVRFVFSILVLTSSIAFATTYYVDPDGNDLNAGTSWATAFKTINKGIYTSANGDVVKINEGTYKGNGNRDLDFGGKAIAVSSKDPNDPCVVAATIIDCNGTINDPHRGFYFHNGEGTNSILSGLTITNGFGPWESGDFNAYLAAGIFCKGSSPTISKCVIRDQNANDAASYCSGIGCTEGASPIIENCTIRDNISGTGGAIFCWQGHPTIRNCLITNNTVSSGGAGIGLWEEDDVTNIINCTIVNNSGGDGGGIRNENSSPIITNCIFWSNTGGEIINSDSSPTVTYSCVEGGYAGTGNISTDPCFVNAYANNFHLEVNSPCINAGDPDTTGSGEMDIDNTARNQNSRVDIGADETPPIYNIQKEKWYSNIQSAINEANNGDAIIVAQGTYTGNENRDLDFGGKAITLSSTAPNDWNVVAATIIDGGGYPAVTFSDGEDSNSVLSGLTLRNGGEYWIISAYSNSSPTIKNCIITDSWGGVYFSGGSPVIENCIVSDSWEIGILCEDTVTPIIRNNWIYGSEGDEYNNGYGIYFAGATGTSTIVNNTITNNGYGVYVESGTEPNISNCIIWNDVDDLYGCSATYSCIQNSFDSNDPNFIGSISSDPCFVNADTNNFHLDINSPCIDKGNPYRNYLGEQDIDNSYRVRGGGVDIGADEIFAATCFYVDPDGNDLNTGTSWAAAFKTINNGINTAIDGDIIEVNEGIYYETINFDGKVITIHSTDPNDGNAVAATIIDANDSNEAVLFISGENNSTILSGFTIKGSLIAGIWCESSSPIISNCIVTDNDSNGIVCEFSETPIIKNSKIYGNTNDGISIYFSDVEIKNNLIYNNARGIAFDEANVVIVNNSIVNNNTAGIYYMSERPFNMSEQPLKFLWATDSHVIDIDHHVTNTWWYSYQSAPIKIPFFMDKANEADADFVIFTGDINHQYNDPCVANYTTEENIRCALAAIDNHNPNGIPRHLVIGNHDYPGANEEGSTYDDLTPKEAWLALVKEDANKVPANAYQNGPRAYYSFSDKGYHFVLLDFAFDAQDNNSTNSSTCDHYPLHEREWLEDDLAEHWYERTFVFDHGGGSAEIKNILEEANNVEAVFYGHIPGNAYSKTNSIRYYQLKGMVEPNAIPDANATCYATIDVNENRGFTITGYGNSNYDCWTEKAFQLGGNSYESTIENCIIWNNVDDLYGCNATYSCISDYNDVGDANITHNICSDPCFADADSNDFHLASKNSPCFNTGDPNFTSSTEKDIDGEDRVMGMYGQERVDMGADELGCLASSGTGYSYWKILGRPKCWCYRRQCRGDSNGSAFGGKPVTAADLTNFQLGYNKTITQLKGLVDENGVPAICGDYNHSAIVSKPLTAADVTIFQSYYNKTTTQVPECSGTHINFWTN